MIDIRKLKVPKGIQFISQWKEYSLPKGEHCIVDKGVTGCGYTEYCLTNEDNIILCSPRKLLLENKRDQHITDSNILYLENNVEDFKDATDIEEKISNHIVKCMFDKKPVKFMVTYDSLHYISEYLIKMKIIDKYIFVIDEFQAIFLDSYFKAEVENSFVEYLQDCTSVIYLSATPMLTKYLEMLDYFKDLKFYEIDWSESGYVDKIKFQRKNVKSLTGECNKIIQDYLSGNYPILVTPEKKILQSTEAVFYFNSVGDIIRCINKNKLTPANTIVICANTETNRKKLRKIKFNFGKIPLKGEKYPMFMFCTSSVYMGVDFYSDCASTYVFANPNLRNLALDISMDLPQIVGRQRNKNNQFKNNVTIFYKLLKNENLEDKSQFDKLQFNRKEKTYRLINIYNKVEGIEKSDYSGKIRSSIEVENYCEDFASVSRKTGEVVYNNLIEVANERAWEVAQKDYQDSINVTRAISSLGYKKDDTKDKNDVAVNTFLLGFNQVGDFESKMKLYCEFRDKNIGNMELEYKLHYKITSNYGDDNKFENYYNFYGTSGCRAKSYIESDLRKGISNNTKEEKLEKEIFCQFKPGDKLSKQLVKDRLKQIYLSLEIESNPKANDLEKWFELKSTTIKDKSGKWTNGFEIIKKKGD